MLIEVGFDLGGGRRTRTLITREYDFDDYDALGGGFDAIASVGVCDLT